MRKNFRTFNLAVDFFQETEQLRLPKHLKDQQHRASSSIALNLAEGSGRSSRKEQKRFFNIAFASLRESQAILDLTLEDKHTLIEQADSLAAHLYRLIQYVKREIQ